MGYRDEKESLRARVTELESELAKKEEAIARLEGRRARAEATGGSFSRILNAPEAVILERTFDHDVSTGGLEAIATALRERLRLPVSQVGRSVRGDLGTLSFVLTTGGGRTTVRLQATYGDRRRGFLIVGPVAGLFMSGVALGILGPFALAPAAMGVAMIGSGVGAALGLQHLIRRTVRKEQANVVGAFEAVSALAETHRKEEVRARVAIEDGEEEELEKAILAAAPASEG